MLQLLREDASSSFSELWYRLGPTRPALSPHARLIRQSFGGAVSYIVEDPAGGQYYRLSEPAQFFIGLLDGRRTVDDAWEACNAQLGDDAPTQRECVELLSKLQLFGLLEGDGPLEPDMIETRRREAASRRRMRRTGRGLSLVLPLHNPEPWLNRCRHLLRPIFSPIGAAVWAALVLWALIAVVTHADDLASQLNGVLDPSNLLWLAVVFTVLRAWHELGHAAACKAMGGRCTEMGVMVIALLLPFPYCDTSSAWRLPSVRARVIVSAGGMLFETFIAAIATIVWAGMGDDEAGLTRTLLYNTMLISGVTTLVFNLNPLLRYDGYYILSDLTGVANLAQRSQELWKFIIQRRVFRVAARPPAVRTLGEFWLMLVYGALSFPYRIVVLFSIVYILWINETYMALGALLAVIAFSVWVVWPILKSAAFLLTSPALVGRRSRAVAITGAVLLVLAAGIGLVPAPAAGYAWGTVEPVQSEGIRATEDGFVSAVHVRPGDVVKAGAPIITLTNAQVQAELEMAHASVLRAQAGVDEAALAGSTDRMLAKSRLTQAEAILRRAQERSDMMVVRATIDGHVLMPPGAGVTTEEFEGRFVEKGSLLLLVAATDQLMVRCVVSDLEHAYIFRGDDREVRTTVRVKGAGGRDVPAAIARRGPAGSRFIADPSLRADSGGDIIMDPTDPEGRASLSPLFLVEVEPRGGDVSWQPGLRARVRFEVPPRPLAVQWLRRLRQLLGERAA